MQNKASFNLVGALVVVGYLCTGGCPGQIQAAEPAFASGSAITLKLPDGTTIDGALRRVQPSVYLVQTEEQLVEITEDELKEYLVVPQGADQAEFLATTREASPQGGRLLRYETYEVVAPNGDVDFWSHTETVNESKQVLTYVQWGSREDELPRYRAMTVFDQFGNRLAHRHEPRPGTDLYNIIVDLAVPVAPGEKVSITMRYVNEKRVHKDGQTFNFVFSGDFPEDRIYHRKIVLPAGAKIESVSPEPWLNFEHGDRQVIVWHRYYPRGEEFPLTVNYKLSP